MVDEIGPELPLDPEYDGVECRAIDDFPRYAVCSNGRVKNIDTGRVLKANKGRLHLLNDDGRKHLSVRKLLLENFQDLLPPSLRGQL